MSNIYQDFLKQLRNVEPSSHPAVSLYVPLKWNDFEPAKIFKLLFKTADELMNKNGHKRLEILTPDWNRWMRQGTVTLAIFHHKGVTTLIPLPTRMQPRVVVAKSFHIKPIVTASHEYIDSLLLHFNELGASLYRISPAGEELLESYLPSKILPKTDWQGRIDRQTLREFLEFLQSEVKGSKLRTTKILGVSGAALSEFQSEAFWKKTGLPVAMLSDPSRSSMPHNSISIMRLRLAQMINERHTQSVRSVLNSNNEFQENATLVSTLATKILNKQIRQLCVSLECMHFGEVDAKTGTVVLNRFQQNAHDDDILDDLVEMALDRGIEVSVVPKKYLPQGRSFVAS